MEISNFEHRAVIKFLVSENCGYRDIHQRLLKYSQGSGPSLETVRRWCLEFRRGRTSIEDDPHPGRPISITTPETVTKVRDIVMLDRRVKVRQIAEELSISTSTAHFILTEKLGMKKMSARWVPKILTQQQKTLRAQYCQENLDFMCDEPDFFSTLVTGDETWCYYYDPESKAQSMQWKRPGSPAQVKGKREKSTKKLMATVFWDDEGIILLEFMPRNSSITGTYYAKTLENLKVAISNDRPRKRKKKIRLLHDNAPAHTAKVSKDVIREKKFEELFHPPYSPDLAPSDYYLFRNLKTHLKGHRFSDDDEVMEAVKSYFDQQPKSFFKTGIDSLKLKWEKCVQLRGEYIEKQ